MAPLVDAGREVGKLTGHEKFHPDGIKPYSSF
jgi:hypothetical protein